ncbi:hypothetical protein HPB47_028442, partial [Ixodes persulcatus]
RPRYASVLGCLRSFLSKFSRLDKGCFTRCRSAEMVVYCSVPQSNTYHGETGTSFYYYPRNRKVRKEWLIKLKMDCQSPGDECEADADTATVAAASELAHFTSAGMNSGATIMGVFHLPSHLLPRVIAENRLVQRFLPVPVRATAKN